ncbi:C39 family peptidase [Rhizomonospora bruguierae]|uniref:C39 family peptidase n=1 Tax=Rhizomonospora bruguierae TaxID=1581705 RepID=UPI001BCDFD27|nr:C39 family peptidase [Micromonospora sp. NBRC 107566]
MPVGEVAHRRWSGDSPLGEGALAGTRLAGTPQGGVRLADPVGRRRYTDPHTGVTAAYEYGTWTSPEVRPGFSATELIPSWTAATPGGSWILVEARGRAAGAPWTGWYDLGHWAAEEEAIRRTSIPGQRDPAGAVKIDTLVAPADRPLDAWQLRVTLLRPEGTADVPVLRSAGAVASGAPAPAPRSRPGPARGVTIDVPAYSQRVHSGHYPQWDGGGDSWCSPTCTTMVLAHWDAGPAPADLAWVDADDPNPRVDHAARCTYDHAYPGAGNWPFNTAYAGRYGMDAFVTRLRSLAEAEAFVAAGIPLILSVSYRAGQVPGLDYDTSGHLVVLAGFAADGRPVLNDPAAATDATVRKAVGRAEFEAAWQTTSHGVAYVIRPEAVPLPLPWPAQAV